MAGIPNTKYQCLVLWWNTRMPMIEPILPPIRAMIKSVDSGIRQWRLVARDLSMPIKAKLSMFIMTRYPKMMLITIIRVFLILCVLCCDYLLFFSASCIFIARTLHDRPNRLMKPSASWWSYKSPVVNDAILSLYNEYGLVSPALIIFPL